MSGMNCITQSTSIGSDKDAKKDPNSVFGKFLNALPDTTKPKEDAAKRKHEWWQAKANLSDLRKRDKVRVAAVADDQRAVARCVGPAGGERGLPGQRVRIVRCCGHQHDRQQAHLRGVADGAPRHTV